MLVCHWRMDSSECFEKEVLHKPMGSSCMKTNRDTSYGPCAKSGCCTFAATSYFPKFVNRISLDHCITCMQETRVATLAGFRLVALLVL